MKSLWSKMVILVVVMGLLAMPLLAACGDDDDNGSTPGGTTPPPTTAGATSTPTAKANGKNVVFTLGNLTDLTGPAATSLAIVDASLADMVKYYNENNLIPGVTLEVLPYDTAFDPAKSRPGYEWLKERGADAIVTGLSQAAVAVKGQLADDKMVILCISSDEQLLDTDGWVWSFNDRAYVKPRIMMKWIWENDWDQTKGPVKIGLADWDGPPGTDYAAGMEAYCKEHPDQFQWRGAHFTAYLPTWGPEVEALKGCDYVMTPRLGFAVGSFAKEYRAAGGKATFLGTDSHPCFFDLMEEIAGLDAVDGFLFTYPDLWFNEKGEIPDLANTFIENYHSASEAQTLKSASYLGPVGSYTAIFQILIETVKRVGPENLNGQTIYETCSSFTGQFQGQEPWSISLDKRTSWDYEAIYKWSAADKQVHRISDWQPIVE